MSNDRKPDWQWRPATEADVGRLCRFRYCGDMNDTSIKPGFKIGFLNRIENNSYLCERIDNDFCRWYGECEVQYDANEEPL